MKRAVVLSIVAVGLVALLGSFYTSEDSHRSSRAVSSGRVLKIEPIEPMEAYDSRREFGSPKLNAAAARMEPIIKELMKIGPEAFPL